MPEVSVSLKEKIKGSKHFEGLFHKNAIISFSISRQLFLVRTRCTKLPIIKKLKMLKTQNKFLVKVEILIFLFRYFMCS